MFTLSFVLTDNCSKICFAYKRFRWNILKMHCCRVKWTPSPNIDSTLSMETCWRALAAAHLANWGSFGLFTQLHNFLGSRLCATASRYNHLASWGSFGIFQPSAKLLYGYTTLCSCTHIQDLVLQHALQTLFCITAHLRELRSWQKSRELSGGLVLSVCRCEQRVLPKLPLAC